LFVFSSSSVADTSDEASPTSSNAANTTEDNTTVDDEVSPTKVVILFTLFTRKKFNLQFNFFILCYVFMFILFILRAQQAQKYYPHGPLVALPQVPL
jgi:hypothetical protein